MGLPRKIRRGISLRETTLCGCPLRGHGFAASVKHRPRRLFTEHPAKLHLVAGHGQKRVHQQLGQHVVHVQPGARRPHAHKGQHQLRQPQTVVFCHRRADLLVLHIGQTAVAGIVHHAGERARDDRRKKQARRQRKAQQQPFHQHAVYKHVHHHTQPGGHGVLHQPAAQLVDDARGIRHGAVMAALVVVEIHRLDGHDGIRDAALLCVDEHVQLVFVAFAAHLQQVPVHPVRNAAQARLRIFQINVVQHAHGRRGNAVACCAARGRAWAEITAAQHQRARAGLHGLAHAAHILYRMLAVTVRRHDARAAVLMRAVPAQSRFQGRALPPVLFVRQHRAAHLRQRREYRRIRRPAAVVHYKHRAKARRQHLLRIGNELPARLVRRDHDTNTHAAQLPIERPLFRRAFISIYKTI